MNTGPNDNPPHRPPVMRIVGWQDFFESGKSKEYQKCSHVYVPNKQDGEGFTNLMDMKDGATHYGIFMLLAGACSRQPRDRNGYLTSNGRPGGTPWTAESIAKRYRRRPAEVRSAIKALMSLEVGWVEIVDSSQPEGEIRNHGSVTGNRTAPLTNEDDTKTKEDDDESGTDGSLVVAALLKSVGIADDDPIHDHPNTQLPGYVRLVVDNLHARGSKIENRAAWVCDAIRRGTDRLCPKAKAARERTERATRSAAKVVEEKAEATQVTQRQARAAEVAAKLTDTEAEAYKRRILDTNPQIASIFARKDPRTDPYLQLKILELHQLAEAS